MGNETSLIRKCTISSKPRHTTSEWSLFDASYESQSFSVFVFTDDQYLNDITVSGPLLRCPTDRVSFPLSTAMETHPPSQSGQMLRKWHPQGQEVHPHRAPHSDPGHTGPAAPLHQTERTVQHR